MYIHEDPNEYTQKCGKYFEESIRFDNQDKMKTLSRMVDYIFDYMNYHNIKDDNVINRCNKIKDYCNNYFNNKGTWVNWIINDNVVQTGMRMIEYCVNHIEENKIKDRKAINRCWDIRCISLHWKKGFKCQGA